MPSSLQLVGRAREEAPLLATAKWCEHVLGFDAVPPVWRDERST
jgi:Asp-tRNA(Asn)/Glu-tRNA(Gln) amidotransferase A subunit family amidase